MAAQIAVMYDASGNDDAVIDVTIGTSRDSDTGNDIALAVQSVKLMIACTQAKLLPRMTTKESVRQQWDPTHPVI